MLDMYQFETYINGFLEPKSPNFDPNNTFLRSIEAEMITFLPKKAVIVFYVYIRPVNISMWLPFQKLIARPKRPLKQKMVLLSTL